MFVLDKGKRFVIPRTEMTYPGHSMKLHQNAADPVKSPKLLRSFDAVTGRAIAGGNGTGPGAAYCGACHGLRANAAANTASPGYWTRTGGDRVVGFKTSIHGMVATSTTSGVGCLNCHGAHGAPTATSLLRQPAAVAQRATLRRRLRTSQQPPTAPSARRSSPW